ncbi:MAG: hypothetical protein U1E83_10615 [Methylotetracoccus sp.]
MIRELDTTRTSVIVKAAMALGVLATANPAVGHEQKGSLGRDPGATDQYQVICTVGEGSGDPHHLTMSVLDRTAGPAMVSVQVSKGFAATNTTDFIGGDTKFSTESVTVGGGGVYGVLVDKNGKGAQNYALSLHCQDIDNIHAGTAVQTLQNQ